MKICVVSDIHYKIGSENAEERQRHETILSFFRSIVGQYDMLILNGDIFDLWTESRLTLVKGYFPLLHVLALIAESGTRLIYVSGNHDFWFGDFFRDILPLEIYPDRFSFTADGRKILVCHGDDHTENDLRYRIFRRVVRSEIVRRLYSLLHPDLALEIGRAMSRSSRNRRTDTARMRLKTAGLESYAKRQIKSKGQDIVIMGHSHNPTHKVLDKGEYLNSGDWITNFSYVNIIDGITTLCKYDRKSE